MIRPVLTEIGIFLIPFAVYAAFLIASRSDVWVKSSWPLHVVGKLAVAAFLLVIVSLILLAHFSGAPPGDLHSRAYGERQADPGIRELTPRIRCVTLPG